MTAPKVTRSIRIPPGLAAKIKKRNISISRLANRLMEEHFAGEKNDATLSRIRSVCGYAGPIDLARLPGAEAALQANGLGDFTKFLRAYIDICQIIKEQKQRENKE